MSIARNTGIAQTHGEIVIFIDDDAIPDEGWLDALVAELSDPEIWAAGGPVDPNISARYPAGTRITLPEHCIDWVVTEYGAVRLKLLSLEQRAAGLISIAHPDFSSAALEKRPACPAAPLKAW